MVGAREQTGRSVAAALAGALAAFVLGKFLEIALLFLRIFLRARSRSRSPLAPGLDRLVRSWALRLATVCWVAVLGFVSSAHAQVDNAGVLDKALKQFRMAAEGWQNAAQGAATALFWSLAAISLVWTMGQLVLRRAELGELFGEAIRYLLFTGFWFWMLENGPSHARMIMDSMVEVAGQTSGQNMVTPSAIVDIGFHLVDQALEQSTILSPLDSAFGIGLALGILVIVALVAVNMLVTVIACWIVAYGGLIVLGFGGSRWTSDMAMNYYKMILSLALQVMAMVLLVGIGESLLRSYYSALQQDVGLHEQAVLLVVSIVLLVTVNRVPVLIGSLVSGGSPHYALGGGAGAGAAMSALSTAGAVAATGAVVASGGAAAAFGAAKALLGGAGEVAKATMAAHRGGQADMSSAFSDFGARAGVASMLSSGGDGSPSRGGGGSVFPAALTDTAAASSGGTAQGVQWGGHDHASSAERPADSDDAREQPDAVQERGDDRNGAGSSKARSAESQSAPESRRSSGALAVEPSSTPRSQAIEHGSRPESAAKPSGDAQMQRESSGKGAAAAPSSSLSGRASSASSEWTPANEATRPAAASAAPASSPATPAPPPAGAFASSPSSSAASVSMPATRDGAAMQSGGPGQQPALQGAASAPIGALAAASQQAIAAQDLPFSGTGAPERRNPPKAALTPAPLPAEKRAELPAAYSMQTSVDVEAEVAAFRDRG